MSAVPREDEDVDGEAVALVGGKEVKSKALKRSQIEVQWAVIELQLEAKAGALADGVNPTMTLLANSRRRSAGRSLGKMGILGGDKPGFRMSWRNSPAVSTIVLPRANWQAECKGKSPSGTSQKCGKAKTLPETSCQQGRSRRQTSKIS
jgi:hypothetical protein